MKTTERLAKALADAGATGRMYADALAGRYDDFKSDLDFPIRDLVDDARRAGLNDIADRAIAGEFDSTREESDEWAASEDGRATFGQLFKSNP